MLKNKVEISRTEEVSVRVTTIELDYLHSQVYSNVLMATIGVKSVWSMKFALWLMLFLPGTGKLVMHGSGATDEFKKYMVKLGVEPPTERTIKSIIGELLEVGVLVKRGWGIYELNKVIFTSGKVQGDSESRLAVVASTPGEANS